MWLVSLLALFACTSTPEVAPEPSEATPRRERSPKADGWELVKPAERAPERWGGAVCNDGTPAGYAWKAGDPKTWVIEVQGGFFCDDVLTPCEGRKQRLTTTPSNRQGPIPDGATIPRPREHGLFSDDPAVNPSFHDASKATLFYCSSDLWLGERTVRMRDEPAGSQGWYFAGRPTLKAMLESLREQGAGDDAQILILGSSAGGQGVVSNLGLLQSLWRDEQLSVVVDGTWVPVQPLERTPKANRWGPLLKRCESDLRAKGEDPLSCVFGPVWYPYWQATDIDLLVQQSGLDTSLTPVFGAETKAEQDAWRSAARAELVDVEWLYSGGKAYHTLATQPRYHQGEQPLRDLVEDMVGGKAPRQVWFGYPDAP